MLKLLLLLVVLTGAARAQSIDWLTIDGSGGAQSSAAYLANFTLGQPDAGRAVSANYTIVGGFWALENVGPASGLPELHIEMIAGGVRLWWFGPATGFQLQSSSTVPGVWNDVGGVPTDIGPTKSISLRFGDAQTFFRLRKP